MATLLLWDLYQIKAKKTSLTGVMLRGRLRKLAIQEGRNMLVENAQDEKNCARFAVLNGQEIRTITDYLKQLGSDITIANCITGVQNPVLSKLQVNDETRYKL